MIIINMERCKEGKYGQEKNWDPRFIKRNFNYLQT